MPAVVRIGDPLSTGHACTGSTTLAGANQGTVYVNNILTSVVGAPTVSHSNPPVPLCPSHVANINVGSSTVFVEGIPWGRVGDSTDAGAMTGGSPDVFAGG